MSSNKSDFIERLSGVLDRRKRHHWGTNLGFTANRVHRLFKAEEPLPNTAELALIGDAENINLNWLVYGEGPPYRVHVYDHPALFQLSITELLEHVSADTCCVSDGHQAVVIIDTQVSAENKNRPITYRRTTWHAGPLSQKLAKSLNSLRQFRIESDLLERICAGQIGPFELLGNDQFPGLVEDLTPLPLELIATDQPLTTPIAEINLELLVACYNKVIHFKDRTQQEISDEKIAELTWLMYQSDLEAAEGDAGETTSKN